MCAKVGVDPLASNKGFWAELLGIGDFYYELGQYCFFLDYNGAVCMNRYTFYYELVFEVSSVFDARQEGVSVAYKNVINAF